MITIDELVVVEVAAAGSVGDCNRWACSCCKVSGFGDGVVVGKHLSRFFQKMVDMVESRERERGLICRLGYMKIKRD